MKRRGRGREGKTKEGRKQGKKEWRRRKGGKQEGSKEGKFKKQRKIKTSVNNKGLN